MAEYEIEVRNRNSFNSAIKIGKKAGFKCRVGSRDAECFNRPGDSLIITLVSTAEAKKRGWR